MSAGNVAIAFEDAALIEQCRRGDLSAIGPLIEKYQDRVYNTCWRLCGNADDAADLTQEAFVKAIEALGQFDGRSRFYTWVFRIAVNLSISHRRTQARRKTVALERNDMHRSEDGAVAPAEWIASAEITPDRAADHREQQDLVMAALSQLEEEQRSMIVLRDLEAFDYQQIAEILDVPLGTVKSKLHRARMALKARLGPALGVT